MGLVRAEVRKLTTVSTTWVLTGVGMLLTLVTAAVFSFAGELTGTTFAGTDQQVADAIDQIGGNSIIVLVVGLLAMTTEFRHGTVGRTFQVTPSRTRVVVAKMLAASLYAVAFLVLGLLVVAAVLGVGAIVSSTGLTIGSAATTSVWQGLVGLVLTALLGVALGSLIRSQVVALTVMLVWVFIVESLVGVAAPRIAQWMPFRALNAVFVSPEANQAMSEGAMQLLDPLVGLAAFIGYVVVAAGAAIWLMRVRDV